MGVFKGSISMIIRRKLLFLNSCQRIPLKIQTKTRKSFTNFRGTEAGNNRHPAEEILSDLQGSVHKLECPIKRKPRGAGWRRRLSAQGSKRCAMMCTGSEAASETRKGAATCEHECAWHVSVTRIRVYWRVRW